MERELAPSHALLAMEERRNSKLPQPVPGASAEEYSRRFNAGVTEYMAYLREHEILTIRDWMDGLLRARIGSFSPGPREFFGEVDYRDPELMRTHGYHWFDKGFLEHEPRIPARFAGARSSTTSSTRAPRGTRRAGKS